MRFEIGIREKIRLNNSECRLIFSPTNSKTHNWNIAEQSVSVYQTNASQGKI